MSRKIIQYHENIDKESSDKDKNRKLIITNYKGKDTALLIKNNRLISLYTIENDSIIGNIYVGKVKNVVKNLNACFVEISNKEIAYLPFSEAKNPILLNRKYDGRILQEDELLVMVQKDAMKTKQAGLTTRISSATDTFVFTCEDAETGISNKLSKELRVQIRQCLKDLENNTENSLNDIGVSCVVRTNAGRIFEENNSEFINRYKEEKENFLNLLNKAKYASCCTCIKNSLKPYLGILNRFPANSYDEVVTDLNEAYTSLQDHLDIVRFYDDDFSLVKLYGLDTKIKEALNNKVWLPSGGYLVIEQTECLTTIDVNSGKMIKSKDKESNVWDLNEEAAYEAATQIRLRNLSGIIIIDFVNMEDKDKEEKLIVLMKDLLESDPVASKVIDITPLGLMEITRKKVYKSLKEQLVTI